VSSERAVLGLAPIVGPAIVLYVVVLFAIAFWVRGRIRDEVDYVVAGRRLSLWLSAATLFATWYGAGTLLATADAVGSRGLRVAALDPIGAGLCLLLAGLFFAGPLWRMQILTLADFFRVRFGPRAEIVGSLIMVPGYFGWIAAQLVAVAAVLELYLGLGLGTGIALVALVGTGYTLIGGMWSVTVTDALQGALLVLGLLVTAAVVLAELGGGAPLDGWLRLVHETPAERLTLIPTDDLAAFLSSVGLLCAGALGNLPGQDLTQRIFAARSASTARRACLVASAAYLAFGAIPLGLGLAAALLAPEAGRAVLPLLAGLVLHPALAVVFVLAILSAVLSTLDSAILAPATVLAQNVFNRLPKGRAAPLLRNELAVLVVAAGSLAVAYAGEDAWSLLEPAYELGLVSLLVPLALGLWFRRGQERAALAAMIVGTALWTLHLALGWEWFAEPLLAGRGTLLPMGLSCAALGLVAYGIAARSSAAS
jgi:Na+/proline symporter